jgi:hypothetical protein
LPRAAKLRRLQALVEEVFGGASGPASYGTYYDSDQLYQWLGAGLWSNDRSGLTSFGVALRQVTTVSKPESRRHGGQRKRFVQLTMPRHQVAWGGLGRRGKGRRASQEQKEEKVKESQEQEEGREDENGQDAPLCGYRYKACPLERVPKAGGWFKLCVEHARKAKSYKQPSGPSPPPLPLPSNQSR